MKSRDQGSGKREQEQERMKELLRSAISPVNEEPMDRDLWPAMLRRIHEQAFRIDQAVVERESVQERL